MFPLELEGITCEFPGVRALDDVTLAFLPGEIHALAGENGAGKSTLLKVISGLVIPTKGSIKITGQTYRSVRHPRLFGIRAIPQEPELAVDLSIAENIFLGQLPKTRWKTVDWQQAFLQAQKLMIRVGLGERSPQLPVSKLGLAEQQLVEIARALAENGQIFLFDEPTACLSPADVSRLGEILKELKQMGKLVLYVSHRLEEIFSFCDCVSILRDGQLVGSRRVSETNPQELIQMMVGREIVVSQAPEGSDSREIALRVEKISSDRFPRNVSLEVRRGEIVGIAGLVGAGRTELLQTIFGARPVKAGKVFVFDHEVQTQSPQGSIDAGIAFVPEDRKQDGLALALSIADNISLPNMKSLEHYGLLRSRKKRELAERMARQLDIRHSGVDALALHLSGGNQQKVVLGKWLARAPSILLLDEPTRGIDVGAKAEIHSRIRELARAGMAILLVSSELPDLLSLSDRILVMREGEIAGELERPNFHEESVMRLATPGYQDIY
jgi:ribose transport system ATP-binding protein